METGLTELKALADETRLKIVKLLLQHKYCVRALARRLELSYSAISQHLKRSQEVHLFNGERCGYFMHFTVNRAQLLAVAVFFKDSAEGQRGARRAGSILLPETVKEKVPRTKIL